MALQAPTHVTPAEAKSSEGSAPVGGALPQGIEIFKPGRHTAMAGQEYEFSEADLRRMAASYNPAQREAPLCVGHPEHDKPAYGFVKGLAVNAAGRLVMDTHQVAPAFAELVRDGRYKKRSAAFYPPLHPGNPTPGAWYLRHVAFLGAQPPAVPGLAEIAFSGDEQGLIAFAEDAGPDAPVSSPSNPPEEPSTMTEAEKAELERQLQAAKDEAAAARATVTAITAERDAAAAQAAAFAEGAKATRLAAHTAFAEAQIKAGALLPKDKLLTITALETLADAQPVEFAEGDATRKVSLAAWLQERLSAAKPAVAFGEFAPGRAAQPASAAGGSDAEIDRAAKTYAARHKVCYAEALTAVTAFAV